MTTPGQTQENNFLASISSAALTQVDYTPVDPNDNNILNDQVWSDMIHEYLGTTVISVQGAINNVNTFFNRYSATNPYPATLSAFAQAFTATTVGFNNFPADGSAIISSFANQIQTILQGNSGNDLSLLTPPPNYTTMASNIYASFVANYPKSSYAGGVNSFFTAYNQFLTTTAVVMSATTTTPQVPSYEQYYQAYFPNATQASFQATLNTFYQQQLALTGNGNPANGFFLPSQAYTAWTTFVNNQYNATLNTGSGYIYDPAMSGSSVTTASSKDVVVIDKVISALISMIGTLQAAAAAQSHRLNFISNWQTAYTSKANAIHYFLQSSTNGTVGQADASGSSTYSTARSNLNDFNTNLTQQLQGKRQVLSDQAKSVQSNVNSSTDASNQQASTVDSLISLLGQLLGSIFK